MNDIEVVEERPTERRYSLDEIIAILNGMVSTKTLGIIKEAFGEEMGTDK